MYGTIYCHDNLKRTLTLIQIKVYDKQCTSIILISTGWCAGEYLLGWVGTCDTRRNRTWTGSFHKDDSGKTNA